MVSEVNFPSGSKITQFADSRYSDTAFKDAFYLVSPKIENDSVSVYFAVFSNPPRIFERLMKVRNKIAPLFGFSSGDVSMCPPLDEMKVGGKAGFLTFVHVDKKEVIATASDAHMTFWLSVLGLGNKQYIVSTLVELKTKRSRIYMRLVKPFHKKLAVYALKRSLKKGFL